MKSMIIELDEITGQISAQFPDIWVGIYPKGHKIEEGKDKFYNGACLIRKGNEHLHLNAFDLGDLLRFLADDRVNDIRDNLNTEHIAANLLRSVLLTAATHGDTNE